MKRISGLAALLLALGCSSTPEPKINSEKTLQSIVLEKAKDYQIIHFGEGHKIYKDDLFVTSILPKLRTLGFSYLAVELDTHEQPLIDQYLNGQISPEEFNQRGPYGVKTFLPMFITAHHLGYEVVLFDERLCNYTAPGDKTCSSYVDRDLNQFNNLRQIIFDKEPDAKVVIFSGRDHIDKIPKLYFPKGIPVVMIPNHKALGYYLKHYTNNRSLSVSLVENLYKQDHAADYIAPDLALSVE